MIGSGFGSLASGRNNNLNLLRMLAAVAVILSHSYPLLLGVGTPEPFDDALGYALGGAAVRVFFALSGFLILMSFERRRSLLDFLVARAVRLVPGLLAVAVLSVAVLGPLLTTMPLGQYVTAPETWRHVPYMLSLMRPLAVLAGTYGDNPYQLANGSL